MQNDSFALFSIYVKGDDVSVMFMQNQLGRVRSTWKEKEWASITILLDLPQNNWMLTGVVKILPIHFLRRASLFYANPKSRLQCLELKYIILSKELK